MPETDELLAEVKRLRQEQEDQGEIIQALMRHSGREVRAETVAALRADPTLLEILLAVDGSRSQGDILADLQARGIQNSSPMSVSRRFRILSERLHLIRKSGRSATGIVYRRTTFEKSLGIVRELERERRR
jgi:hypothetical protein